MKEMEVRFRSSFCQLCVKEEEEGRKRWKDSGKRRRERKRGWQRE